MREKEKLICPNIYIEVEFWCKYSVKTTLNILLANNSRVPIEIA